jgi:spore germination protein GerM
MKRILLLIIPAGVLFACTVAPAATVPPAATPASTQIPPVNYETNSAPADTTIPAGGLETPPPQEADVVIYFTAANDADMTPVPVRRTVPNSDNPAAVIHSTLKELVKGPTDAEKTQGLISWFSADTTHALQMVLAYEDSLTVDFTGLPASIPNASTSAGSQMLLSQLNSTVFQFPSVASVKYSLDGDCAAFWEWLQYECHTVTRADWEQG